MTNIIPGQQLGPYRIIAQIGQGGMAAVYKAYHAAMDRHVAVKVLPSEFAKSPAFTARFQQEARTVANLEHPHILPVHDFGESDGITYLVMRYLEAGTLASRIEHNPPTLPEIDRIFSQLAGALAYAHHRGVVHRDLKPSNVLIDSRGDVFLTDFGIAKILEGSSKFTTTGTITGTPAYMSPEQAQGERVDQRSDIYSLGIVLYELVTGQVPFDADTPLAVLLKHVNAPLPLPSQIKPDVHPDIERVLLKALSKNRDDRYASCDEFLEAWKAAYLAAQSGAPTRLQASPPTRLGAAPTVLKPGQPQPAAPARKLPMPLLAVLGVVGVGALCLAAVVGGGLALRQFFPEAAATVAQNVLPGSTPRPGETSQPFFPTSAPVTPAPPLPEGAWESWAAGNTIYKVFIYDDLVYAAGWGGVSVWDRTDGALVRRFTTADGLTDADLSSIYVDGEDSVWVGGERGLVHFDGDNVRHYDTADGLDSDYIAAIAPLRDGSLMVGTIYSGIDGGGLNIFQDGAWRRVENFPSGDPGQSPDKLAYGITAIYDDGTFLWVGTENGLGRFDGSEWTMFFESDGLPHSFILTLNFDPTNNTLLIGTRGGAATFDGGEFRLFPDAPPDGVFGIIGTFDAGYWLSGGGGLYRINLQFGDVEVFNESNSAIPSYGVYGGAIDADGVKFFGTEWGLLVVRPGAEFEVWTLPNVPGNANFGWILPEPNGRVWFLQASGAGFDIFDPATGEWQVRDDLPGFPIYIDRDGNVWANNYPGGMYIISPSGETLEFGEEQGFTEEAFVRGVGVAPDGTTGLITSDGLALFDGQAITAFIRADETGLPSNFIRTALAASDGSVWVSGDVGLARRNPDGAWETFGQDNPFEHDGVQVYDIAEDANNDIWIATNGNGVYRYRNGEWDHFDFDSTGGDLPSDVVYSVTASPDTSLWVGTSGGAARFDGVTWQAFFDSPDRLISPIVNDIYVAPDGTVYFATEGGMTRFQP